MTRLVLFGPLMLLAACGGPEAKVIGDNAQGVSVRYDGSDSGLNKANHLAKSACADHGRIPALLSSSKLEDSHVAAYECRTAD